MTREELNTLWAEQFELAQEIIESGQEHRPILACLPRGPIADVGALMADANGKNFLSHLMRRLSAIHEGVCLVCEAWVTTRATTNLAELDPSTLLAPSEDPARFEAVIAAYTVKNLGYAIAAHKIIREGKKARLERGALMFPQQAKGRFVT